MKTTKKQAKKQTIRVNLPLGTLTEAWDKRPDPDMNLDETIEYFFLKGMEIEHGIKICRKCQSAMKKRTEQEYTCPQCGNTTQ